MSQLLGKEAYKAAREQTKRKLKLMREVIFNLVVKKQKIKKEA